MTALGAVPSDLLLQVVAVEAAVIGLGLVVLLVHGAVSGPAGRRRAAALAEGRAALEAILEADGAGADEVARLASLPRRVQVEVLIGVAASLTGAQRQRLTALAGELGLLTAAEVGCRSRLWWRRLRGVRLLTLLGGGRAAVPALLRDRRPEVRAQAAQWAVEHHDDEVVEILLRMLADDDPSTRFTVKDSLIRIGRPVTAPLAAQLSGPGGPSRVPALDVAAAMPDAAMLPAALALCQDDDARVRASAATLAGAIGGGPAVEVLTGLLGDEVPAVRAAAVRALGRAGHWPAAAALAGLLGDPSWDVRQQAAVALRALGSPGLIFLRRGLSSTDAFAADAARHVLDLPDSVVRTL